MNRLGVLSIKDVLNYNYCPRIVYFEYVLRIPQRRTVKEDAGLEAHNNFVPRAKRNRMEKRLTYDKKLFNLPLHSPKHNLQTVVDCILIDSKENMAIPMQFKRGKAPSCLYRTMKFQLVAEALLIEECLGFSCPFGLVKFLPEEKTLRTEIGFEQKEELKYQLCKINDVVRSEMYPEGPKTQNFCTDCCYFNKICQGYES